MQEIMARDGKVLHVPDKKGIVEARDDTWETLILPELPGLLDPIFYAIQGQLISH